MFHHILIKQNCRLQFFKNFLFKIKIKTQKDFINFITHPVFIWVVVALLVIGLGFLVASYLVASHMVYVKTLKRQTKDTWSREVPSELEERSVQMYNVGRQWATENAHRKHDVLLRPSCCTSSSIPFKPFMPVPRKILNKTLSKK